MARKVKAEKHIHKVMKVGPTWKCILSCKYSLYFKQEHYLIGLDLICWGCGNKFRADEDALRLDQPACYSCRTPAIDDLDELIGQAERAAMTKNKNDDDDESIIV